MNRSYSLTLICLISLLIPGKLFAQKNETSALLWRISGKDLSKPSFLYGTIHLKDKKVFSFPDSLYAAIEQTEGFAIEIHPDSMMQALLNKEDESKPLVELLKPADFKKIRNKLLAEFKATPEKVTLGDLQSYCTARYYRIEGENSMNTFMDSYLYGAAARSGKWTGGIEDVEDQLNGIAEQQSPESTAEEFLQTDKVIRTRIDSMINQYLSQNVNFMSGLTANDTVMIRRNKKMAHRMDSLMNIRSMVFAVGAGHLTGKDGVVGLLRSKGYAVEPVHFSKREFILDHAFDFKETPWETVKEKNGLYTVQMPGQPLKEYEIPGTDGVIKLYVDLKSGLSYFTFVSPADKNLHYDSLGNSFAKRFDRKMVVKSSKKVMNGAIEGREFLAESKQTIMRFRLFITDGIAYGAYTIYAPTSLVMTDDIQKFFNSFSIQRPTEEMLAARTPRNFSSEESGFRAYLPVKPVIKRDSSSEGVTWQYTSLDMENEAGFVSIVHTLNGEMSFIDDSTQLDAYIENLQARGDTRVLKDKRDTIFGFPANWIDFRVNVYTDSLDYRALNIIRGRRNYYFVAYARTQERLNSIAGTFFSSISFFNPAPNEWKDQPVPGADFSVWAPAPFVKVEDEENEGGGRWVSTDSLSAASILVIRVPHSPYLRITSDTAYLREVTMNYTGLGQDLLNFEFRKNGIFNAATSTTKFTTAHTRRKLRCVLDGKWLTLLFAIADSQALEQPGIEKMFDSFRPSGPSTLTDLYRSKADTLLRALASTDSITSSNALRAMRNSEFTKADLPLLYDGLTKIYREDLYGVEGELTDAILKLKDSADATALKGLYEQLSPGNDLMRVYILKLLASWRTEETHKMAAELFLANSPKSVRLPFFMYTFSDSLELAKPYFHRLMPMIKDSILGVSLLGFAASLLEEKLLQPAEVLQYRTPMLELAKEVSVADMNDENTNVWYYNSLCNIFSKLRDSACTVALRQMLANKDNYVKLEVVKALLELKRPLPAAELLKIAANKGTRLNLYDTMLSAKKIALFPKQYLNQAALAESNLYSYASDEDVEIKSIQFLGERVAVYKKKKQKFYLFKLSFDAEEPESYLAITGPYPLTPTTKLISYGAVDGFEWEETYDPKKVDAQFKAYLKKMEKEK